MNNRLFLIAAKNGKQVWVVIRQAEHDTKYVVGSRIPGYGRVLEVKDPQ